MGTEVSVIQEKAMSLRSYLFEKNRAQAFADALPKWLSVDRLLRVVFASAIRNPRLLDCTKESILQSVMMCATLGLEPILGRAYLIPYKNNRQIAGKWQKIYECQFQPGYQGLVDLARRSGVIADVYGYNVFENDEIDITYGSHRDIHHKPWYMDPKKKANGPGDTLGAYVVWLLKDGTQHPEYMPISDIHQRRDKSPAWQYYLAHKDEKDADSTPWLQWPDDMQLKTVVKHSSKLVPASIEFMTAVQIDDDVETHGRAMANFLSAGELDIGATTSDDVRDIDTEFAALTQDVEPDLVDKFVKGIVEHYKAQYTEQEIKTQALQDGEVFMEKLKAWAAKAVGPKILKDKIGRLKTTGLREWETENHLALMQCLAGEFGVITKTDFDFFLEKWQIVIGQAYTLPGQPGSKTEEPPKETQQTPTDAAKAHFLSEVAKYEDILDRQTYFNVLKSNGVGILEHTDPAKYDEILAALKEEVDGKNK